LYNIRPGNGTDLFLQPWSPHGAARDRQLSGRTGCVVTKQAHRIGDERQNTARKSVGQYSLSNEGNNMSTQRVTDDFIQLTTA